MTVSRAGRAWAVAPALLCALFLAVQAPGCSASTPQRAVGDFVSARIAGKDDRAAELTVEGDLGEHIGGEPFLYASGVTYELEEPRIEGDRAVVAVRYCWDGQSVELPYVARRVGTKWKVALSETAGLWLPDVDMGGVP